MPKTVLPLPAEFNFSKMWELGLVTELIFQYSSTADQKDNLLFPKIDLSIEGVARSVVRMEPSLDGALGF